MFMHNVHFCTNRSFRLFLLSVCFSVCSNCVIRVCNEPKQTKLKINLNYSFNHEMKSWERFSSWMGGLVNASMFRIETSNSMKADGNNDRQHRERATENWLLIISSSTSLRKQLEQAGLATNEGVKQNSKRWSTLRVAESVQIIW